MSIPQLTFPDSSILSVIFILIVKIDQIRPIQMHPDIHQSLATKRFTHKCNPSSLSPGIIALRELRESMSKHNFSERQQPQ
jgi:hypothetical protein